MMQSKWNRIQNSTTRGSWAALLSILVILLFAAAANAVTVPPIVVSQSTWLTAYPSGGVLAGDVSAGGSWGINSKGTIVVSTTYGGKIVQFAGAGYPATVVGSFANAGGAVAVDANDNLYVTGQFSNSIAKIPMSADGTYTFATDPGGSSKATIPACDGTSNDAAGECLLTNLANSSLGYFGVASMTFDAAGDMFFATDDQGSKFSIYECGATCLYGSSPTSPVLIFAEPITTTQTTTGQLYIGGLALDAGGNIFFTDSALANTNNKSFNSHLNELTVDSTSATGFAAAPIVVVTLTQASPANYDDQIDAVFIDKAAGMVYIGLDNSGIYGLTDVAGVVDPASLYAISNSGTKLLASDGHGNFFHVGYSSDAGGDALGLITVGGPIRFSGSTTSADLFITDNSANCATAVLTFSSTDPAFTAAGTTGATCGGTSLGAGSVTPVTVTFAAVTGDIPTGTISVTDTATTASTSFAAKGPVISAAQSTWGQPFKGGGVFGSDNAGGTTAGINSKGVVIIADSYGNYAEQFTNGGTAVTATMHFNGVSGATIDSQDYLYLANAYGKTMVKVPMAADGTYNFSQNPGSKTTGIPACAGDGKTPDTAGICLLSPTNASFTFGGGPLAVDAAGNLFFGTDDKGAAPNFYSIYECNLTCLYGSTPVDPVQIFAEPLGDPVTLNQLNIGGIAVDASDNVYFTDSMIAGTGSNYSMYSEVFKLPVDSTTASGYAAAPTLLETLTPACGAPPCSYNNEIDTVTTDAAGNVYFADQYSAIWEIVNRAGTLDPANPIALAKQGAKVMVRDKNGNFYFAAYNNDNAGDTIGLDSVGLVAVTPMAAGTSVSVTNVSVLDNFGDCSTSPVLAFSFVDTDFTGIVTPPTPPATGSQCGGLPFGNVSTFPATITFTPSASASGTVSTTMTITDTTNNGSGTATVTGIASVSQTITWNNPTGSEAVSYGVAPIVLSATGGASGNPVVFSVASGPATLGSDGITLTITGVGSVVVNADQAGGAANGTTYSPAPTAPITITVNQATQTITGFDPTTPVVYTTTPIALSATGGNSGNGVTFSVISGPGTISGSNLTITGTGDIIVAADQAGNTNYAAATQVQKTITVTKVPQTISSFAGITSPVVFGAAASYTLSAQGGASGSPLVFTIDGTSTIASITGTTLTITGAGSFTIDINQTGTADYSAATQVQVPVTVNQATQTITISANPTTINSLQTSVITATGGASGLPVTLAVTTGSSIATLSGTTLTPTGAAFGNVVVTATQAGNADYSAAAAQTVTVTVNSPVQVATPVITPAAGTLYVGTTNTITITDGTANAVIKYTTDGTNPLTSGTAVTYTAPFTLAVGSYTVTAAATLTGDSPSSAASVAYTVSAIPPDFTAPASVPSLNITTPGSGSVTFTVSPVGGFSSPVTFSLSGGLPIGTSYIFSPTTVTPGVTPNNQTVLTINSINPQASLHNNSNPFVPPAVTFAALLCLFGIRKRRNLQLMLLLAISIVGLSVFSGCGGSAKKTVPPPATVAVTVTETSTTPALSHSTTFNLTVNYQ